MYLMPDCLSSNVEIDCARLQSDALLFESLRRLQLMQLSVEALKATEIGRAVNGLRKHNSKQIRHLVRTLIEDWKVMVDEWVNATAAITDHSHGSVNPSVVDEEEGLPSPPLDEGAFLATQTTSIRLSEFFDGMDDDGNFRISGDIDKSRDNRRLAPESHRPVRRQEPLNYAAISEEKAPMKLQEAVLRQTKPPVVSSEQPKAQGVVNKLSKLPSSDFGPGRPSKLAPEQKLSTEVSGVHRKSSNTPQDVKSKNMEEASVRAKLEIAKRKLQEGYQLAENAKKQRTIQVMELHDLPKQPHAYRPTSGMKPKNQFKNWANQRR
ncbi:putative mediator of RNA polymerase II transcription subunit 26b [Apostasia shenzhenica]|uniref:Putative mediator of RNA polymerase II transcription subunit 26b n=1 Tax=Apostasia shenzhenica TaxID=1088818 RepID=A0A2I0BH87_9ASPA|nr:putative mediator of RNA polymerase II transcription subunit 26b [Apostasia shenzhenica]